MKSCRWIESTQQNFAEMNIRQKKYLKKKTSLHTSSLAPTRVYISYQIWFRRHSNHGKFHLIYSHRVTVKNFNALSIRDALQMLVYMRSEVKWTKFEQIENISLNRLFICKIMSVFRRNTLVTPLVPGPKILIVMVSEILSLRIFSLNWSASFDNAHKRNKTILETRERKKEWDRKQHWSSHLKLSDSVQLRERKMFTLCDGSRCDFIYRFYF